jgi:hypothetical protein
MEQEVAELEVDMDLAVRSHALLHLCLNMQTSPPYICVVSASTMSRA